MSRVAPATGLALLVFPLLAGCAGEAVSISGDASSQSGSSAASSSGTQGASSSSGTTSTGAQTTVGSEGGTGAIDAQSVGDAANDPIPDASIPDAFPASCDGGFTLRLFADASPHTCQLEPSEVACETSTDCSPFEILSCCWRAAVGVNKTNTASCPAPPCAPPQPGGPPCDDTSIETEDCQSAPDLQHVAVACVDHRCMTYATGP
jgi:hypothetical protein